MRENWFPRDLPFPLSHLPHSAGTAFAGSSRLEFYDMNLFSDTVKASGFPRNVPLGGFVAGATRVLAGRLRESGAELPCGAGASGQEAAGAAWPCHRAVTPPHSPNPPRQPCCTIPF